MSPLGQSVVEQAADRWMEVVTGDLPSSPSLVPNERAILDQVCGFSTSFPSGEVDDLNICASEVTIDGPGRIVGATGAVFLGSRTNLPTHSFLRIDQDDIRTLQATNLLDDAVRHEMGECFPRNVGDICVHAAPAIVPFEFIQMTSPPSLVVSSNLLLLRLGTGHCLGIGSLWTNLGLTPSDNPANCNAYSGANANREYRAISGCPDAIPVETGGGPGVACIHWEELCFDTELMTGRLDPNSRLSRLTIGGLADMGYVVNYDAADPFDRNNLRSTCICEARRLGEGGADAPWNRSRQLKKPRLSNTSGDASVKRLSEQGTARAREYGAEMMDLMVGSGVLSTRVDGDEGYRMSMVVYYMEDDEIFDVRITEDDLVMSEADLFG